MREDALASVRRAYRIAGRDHGAHAPPYPPSPRSRHPSNGDPIALAVPVITVTPAPAASRLRPRARGPPSPLRRGVRALPLHRFPSRLPPTPRRRPRRRRPGDGRAHGRHPGVNALHNAHAGTSAKGEGAAFAGAPGGYAASKTRATASETSSSASDVQSSSSSTCGDARARGRRGLRGERLTRPGDRLGPSPLPAPATPEACCAACAKNPSCVAWTLVKDGGVCWLKGGAASRPRSDACCVSGDARPERRRRARRRRAHGRARSPARFVSRRADIVRREGERRGRASASTGRASRSGRGEDFRFGKISEGASAGRTLRF